MALWDVVRKVQSVSLAAREREVAPSLHTTLPWLSQPPSQRQLPWMLRSSPQEVCHPEPPAWERSKAWGCPHCPSYSEAPLSSEPFPSLACHAGLGASGNYRITYSQRARTCSGN